MVGELDLTTWRVPVDSFPMGLPVLQDLREDRVPLVYLASLVRLVFQGCRGRRAVKDEMGGQAWTGSPALRDQRVP